jgi:hypothetical protein
MALDMDGSGQGAGIGRQCDERSIEEHSREAAEKESGVEFWFVSSATSSLEPKTWFAQMPIVDVTTVQALK